jgi:hypothetical protein
MNHPFIASLFFLGLVLVNAARAQEQPNAVIRAGMIGLDTSHGVWSDGRVGAYRGIRRGKAEFGAVVHGSNATVQLNKGGSYEDLCREIGKFFKTRISPVNAEETIEIFAFMEAADESKRQGGKPVALKDVLEKARAAAAAQK